MKKERLTVGIGPWAALVAGLFVYFSDENMFLCLAVPVAVHEIGHILCLRLFGCRICSLHAELSGLCIRYSGDPGRAGEAAAALSGPAAGLLYAWIAARLGPSGELSAGISLLLSAFNLIPALPLDGGRAAEALISHQKVRIMSMVSSSMTALFGFYLYLSGKGAAMLIAGSLLLAAQFHYGISSAISPD